MLYRRQTQPIAHYMKYDPLRFHHTLGSICNHGTIRRRDSQTKKRQTKKRQTAVMLNCGRQSGICDVTSVMETLLSITTTLSTFQREYVHQDHGKQLRNLDYSSHKHHYTIQLTMQLMVCIFPLARPYTQPPLPPILSIRQVYALAQNVYTKVIPWQA